LLYDGTSIVQIAQGSVLSDPKINDNGYVVWGSNSGTYLYDGVSVHLIANNSGGSYQMNSRGDIVWSSGTAGNGQIFLYNGINVTQFTNNSYNNHSPHINSNGDIVWTTTNSSGTVRKIFLAHLNHSPVLNPIGDKSARVGRRLRFTISATDPDESDTLHFTAQNLPQGASFVDNNDGTATFNWIPTVNQAGLHNVLFQVNDGNLSDSEPITINVFALQVAFAVPLP